MFPNALWGRRESIHLSHVLEITSPQIYCVVVHSSPFLSPLAPFPTLYVSSDNVFNHCLLDLLMEQIMSGAHTEILPNTN